MTYIDGFVIPVPTGKRDAYQLFASTMAKVLQEHGALRMVECWGDDVPTGKQTDFMQAVKATSEETVVFSWVEWPSKAQRNTGMQNAMADPRMAPNSAMPFDGRRMIYGGFSVMLDTAQPNVCKP